MKKVLMVIPVMTFFANVAILLGIPFFREVIVFAFLSFVPGFVILELFKLKEISLLDTFLFSVALSIAFAMFMGFLVNELYVFLGISQSLSTIPLTVAASAFTLTGFFIGYRRDLPVTLKSKTGSEGKLKNVIPLTIILFFLPLLSAISVLYSNVSAILLSYIIIAALCVMSVVSRRIVSEKLFPFLILSISVALVCQVLLTSKYVLGWDANLEYYVFRVTQINGHWGFLNPNVNQLITLNFNSMLSITLLPAVYSTLMNVQGGIVFKILYPFIYFLIPLTMYRIFEKMFGNMIALLSVIFFVFTSSAFYGTPIGLNRQIVGELFLLLSVFLLIDKTIPRTKRRWLLIIFGVALVVSHYSLAFMYLGMIALIFIISKIKPEIDDTLKDVTVLFLFVAAFLWYSLGSSSPLISLMGNIETTFFELTTGAVSNQAATFSNMVATPEVFTAASWINLLMSGMANLFLMMGALSLILRPKQKGISDLFRIVLILAALILVASVVAPSIAAILNFERFYGITLLFLSPCFIFGGQALLVIIRKAWIKISRPHKSQNILKSKNTGRALLLISIILCGYFLSQVGFINRVTEAAIHSYTVDFDRMITSNVSRVKISLYNTYIPEQDVFSASWLSNHRIEMGKVFCDYLSGTHVLFSYGLIPNKLLLPITDTTIPIQGSLVYLGNLNMIDGAITTETGSFKTSEISFIFSQNDLVYSNGNSEILYVAAAG